MIERRDIAERQAVAIPDLMNEVPGAARNADGPWASDVIIRGLGRESVVFLIDGARVNTATDLGGRFGLIDPMEVERIEILKGPVSSLYGSGSIGGVVSVVTRGGRFTPSPATSGGVAAAPWTIRPALIPCVRHVQRPAPILLCQPELPESRLLRGRRRRQSAQYAV